MELTKIMISWKLVAIIFIVLFGLSIITNALIINYVLVEKLNRKECLNEVCKDYDIAGYKEGVCTCYILNNLGEADVIKVKFMKGIWNKKALEEAGMKI